jgi:hypothetical protein
VVDVVGVCVDIGILGLIGKCSSPSGDALGIAAIAPLSLILVRMPGALGPKDRV